MRNSFFTTLQRLLAGFIDIFLISLIVAVFVIVGSSTFATVLYFILLLSFPFRDIIFGGRSIGKRLLRLVIINTDDENCFEAKVPITRMILRQIIFIFAGIVEFFALLITGKTLGERISNTAVVSKNRMDDHMLYFEERKQLKERENKIAQEIEQHRLVEERRRLARQAAMQQNPPAPEQGPTPAPASTPISIPPGVYSPYDPYYQYCRKKPRKTVSQKIIISVVAVLLVAVLVFLGINIVPDLLVTSSEGYKTAYTYLVLSSAFYNLYATDDDVEFITKTVRKIPDHPNPKERETIEYHFRVKGQYLKVYCHDFNGVETVCRDCTPF